MRSSVIVFPASNCDRDASVALEKITGSKPSLVWHAESTVPESDLIVLPGGFSFGDYLRSGAMAAQSPIMKDVITKAKTGVPVLGICNGFQVLVESELLPGALMRNRDIKFLCKDVLLKVERNDTIFTSQYDQGEIITIPIAHHDGNYFASPETLKELEGDGRVAFRYVDDAGNASADANPNGSQNNIAGIYNKDMKVLGLMPHPERLISQELGGTDGLGLFESLVEALH
ncbi:MAG: phosphoribosylformylglycinamidine synthase subunit PurQ [Methyloligella sp.]|nr:MAG: phosphoribosylformylglycinamidine synthase subunit PurQ [Methyloligella sp.]